MGIESISIRSLKNAWPEWRKAINNKKAIYLPYKIFASDEPIIADEVRKYLASKNNELCVYDWDDAEDIKYRLEVCGIKIYIPNDNMECHLIDFNGIGIYIQGVDEYQGHGESSFNLGVEGIIPNETTLDEVKMAIDWVCEIFNI